MLEAWLTRSRNEIGELRARIDDDRLPDRGAAQRARKPRAQDPRAQAQGELGLYDPKREEEIFANLAKCNEGPLYADNLREIYEAILHVMKEL